jgi:hypothetical protein
MYVQRDDHATRLIRFLSRALRVLTLMEFVVRRQLAAEGAKLAGVYAGNPKRETDQPTAERLLEAFHDPHADHHQGLSTDSSTGDGVEPTPTTDSGAIGLFVSASYKAGDHFF